MGYGIARRFSEIPLNAILLVPVVLASVSGHVDEPAHDKSGYTLFAPTPREQMRDMSTDRPDVTESPYTVDAGHFQIEMSIAEFTRRRDGGRTDTYDLAPMNLKAGLLNDLDLQLVLTPYSRQESDSADDLSGFGDVMIRVKYNLIGNDSGEFAMGLMPFVSIPTGGEVSSDKVEGGLIVPFAFELSDKMSLGVMAELDAVANDTDGYDLELVHSVTLGRELVGELSGYVEYIGVLPLRSGSLYSATFSTGLTYALTGNIQLDAGTRIGLTAAADDLAVFAGISLRF